MKQKVLILFLWMAGILFLEIPAQAAGNPVKTDTAKTQVVNFDPKDFSTALILGNESAPITLVEFSSISCTHCATYYTTVYPKLKNDYIDKGIVKIVTIHFPYDPLAYLANTLFEDMPYRERHDAMMKLFQTQQEWLPQKRSETEIKKARDIIMKTLGFSEERVKQCSKNQKKIDTNIENIYTVTQKYNITATPTFFINGVPFTQAVTFDNFKAEFDKLTEKG